MARGCLQGGDLSPLLCILVVDELIDGLNGNDIYTIEYEDGIATLISRQFSNSLSELFQEPLDMVQ